MTNLRAQVLGYILAIGVIALVFGVWNFGTGSLSVILIICGVGAVLGVIFTMIIVGAFKTILRGKVLQKIH